MTRAEVSEMARFMFTEFDTDGSGDIDRGELRVMATKWNIPTRDVEAVIAFCDDDGDGDGAGDEKPRPEEEEDARGG